MPYLMHTGSGACHMLLFRGALPRTAPPPLPPSIHSTLLLARRTDVRQRSPPRMQPLTTVVLADPPPPIPGTPAAPTVASQHPRCVHAPSSRPSSLVFSSPLSAHPPDSPPSAGFLPPISRRHPHRAPIQYALLVWVSLRRPDSRAIRPSFAQCRDRLRFRWYSEQTSGPSSQQRLVSPRLRCHPSF